MMENLLSEGRYDRVTTELSREMVNAIKQGKKRIQTRIVLFKRTNVEISVYFHYDDDKELDVYGATYVKAKEIRKHYRGMKIILHVDAPKSQDLKMQKMSQLVPEIKNIVRHEIEHIAQNKFKDRERENFFSNKRRYPEDIEYFEYLMEPYEVEAYVRGSYRKAKTLKQPLNVIFDAWWNYLRTNAEMHEDEIQSVKTAWIEYAKKHLPQTPLRQYGYRDEGPQAPVVDETTPIEESQRVMGFKYKKPEVNVLINFDAPDSGNIKFKLMDLMDRMGVDYNSVTGGGGVHNSYRLDLNLYDEKEAQAIINDLNIRLMVDNVRMIDATYSVREPKLVESRDIDPKENSFAENTETPGALVKMSEEFKTIMRNGGSEDHINEFGDCVGIVLGPAEIDWPEVDVRWRPSNLKYAYDPKHLVLATNYSDSYNAEFFNESILFEAKKDTLKSKWNHVSDEAFNQLVDADPSPTKKYADWMLKTHIDGGYNVNQIIPVIQKFDQINGRITNELVRKGVDAFENEIGVDVPLSDIDVIFRSPKDINSYKGLGILSAVLKQVESKKTKREEKMVGAEKIYEDENFLVVLPKTPEGSCHYGAGTKWCTAAKGSNQFNNYSRRGTLYYIIFKANTALSPERRSKPVWQQRLPKFEKIARFIPNGGDYGDHGEFYDAQDNQVTEDEILNGLFGVTWEYLPGLGEHVSNIPKGSQAFWDSFYKAWTRIDTHYAKNGMEKPQAHPEDDFDDILDDDGWDDDFDPNN